MCNYILCLNLYASYFRYIIFIEEEVHKLYFGIPGILVKKINAMTASPTISINVH